MLFFGPATITIFLIYIFCVAMIRNPVKGVNILFDVITLGLLIAVCIAVIVKE